MQLENDEMPEYIVVGEQDWLAVMVYGVQLVELHELMIVGIQELGVTVVGKHD
jgi:hypothetical protein